MFPVWINKEKKSNTIKKKKTNFSILLSPKLLIKLKILRLNDQMSKAIKTHHPINPIQQNLSIKHTKQLLLPSPKLSKNNKLEFLFHKPTDLKIWKGNRELKRKRENLDDTSREITVRHFQDRFFLFFNLLVVAEKER